MSYKILPWGESNAEGLVSNGVSLEKSFVRILFKKSTQFNPETLRTFLFPDKDFLETSFAKYLSY